MSANLVRVPRQIPLALSQIAGVYAAYNERYGTCELCMPWDEGAPIWIVDKYGLLDAVLEAFLRSDVICEIDADYDEYDIAATVPLLELECPGCGASLGASFADVLGTEVGLYVSPG